MDPKEMIKILDLITIVVSFALVLAKVIDAIAIGYKLGMFA